jgi:iron complex transport system ATP-binding protein
MTSRALRFDDARVGFGRRGRELWALDGVTSEILAGQVTAVVGPNGAGKTTLLRVAAGLVALASGACMLGGRSVSEWPRQDLARHIAYLPQSGDAAWPLPARQVVALGRLPHGAQLGRLAPADETAVTRALERADVLHLADRRIDQLSAGERSRVLFARALATGAGILLADEPAAHLDPAHQLRLMRLLAEEAARGVAVLVTLHELALAAACDRVLVLDRGRIAADGPPEVALSDDVLARIFGVRAARAATPHGASAPVPYALL